MTTITTELAQRMREAAVNAEELGCIAGYSKGLVAVEAFNALATPANVLALLDALEHIAQSKRPYQMEDGGWGCSVCHKRHHLNAVGAALCCVAAKGDLEARTEQQPVAYMRTIGDDVEYNGHNEFSGGGRGIPLYTAPPAPAPVTVKIPYLPADCDRTEAHFKYQAALTAAGIKIAEGE